jgi:hypothetical protein
MPHIATLIDASGATPEFKHDLLAYADHHRVERIQVESHSPRVKVLRVLTQLLSELPDAAIERVRIEAASGCSDFRGTLVCVADGVERTFDFVWDCAWRANEEGWVDYYGFPDQIRAAREFDWRCFARWAEHGATSGPAPVMTAHEAAPSR